MSLLRPGDTRWGSHYKTVCNIITMYEAIHDALVDLGDDPSYKDDWTKIYFVTGAFKTFKFVFFTHLMYIILDIQMSYLSVCKEGTKIFLMQYHLLMWQRQECKN